ncbi:alpha/beta hydrolase family esterase [Corynebacterium urinipleomorphum]|uniref:alpha/beta hydrolase family esterase n=1 Tax=Corynebacterium urinipleomorphum TaxID=1852380 RepID=UPI000B35B900|nr:PHB depolymerase family esterase [Corynebacterium urinipleomorphum]
MNESSSRRIARTVTVDGVERSYQCSVPANAGGGDPLPVILAIHGKGDNGLDFLIGTNLGSANAIVAAPTGQGLAWSPAPYAVTTVEEDTALIHAILDDIAVTYPLDPDRIYLAGFANGGGLVTVLAVNEPERYAGVATVAGAIRTDLDEIAHGAPIDYLNIHGTWDDVVPYAGQDRGSLGLILPAQEVSSAFGQRNGGKARAVHIPVEGMNHEWPAGVWARNRGIDVTEGILDFFGIDTLE